jgi:ribosomal protein L12E/L44/L45/RPP1/RPP2
MAYIYAALTLHSVGKEINEENLRKILESVGVHVDEATVKAMMTLVTALKAKPQIEPIGTPPPPPKAPPVKEKPPGAQVAERPPEERSIIPPTPPVTPPATPAEAAPTPITSATTPAETVPTPSEALYLYCLADGAEEVSFGKIGIEGNEAYTIPYNGISVVVHKCLPEPYQSKDDETVKKWMMAHQGVIDAAWEKFGTVLPLGFDTIVKGDEVLNAEEDLKKWLSEKHENLKEKMGKAKGKAEVGVQIFWDPNVIGRKLAEASEEIKKLNEEMKSKSAGMAYFYKQKIEHALKKEMEKEAGKYFKDFYGRVKRYADDIHVEKTKKAEKDKQMLMNLSVLIHKDKIKLLGEELAKIKEIEGIDVRFTGPWPIYSFFTI